MSGTIGLGTGAAGGGRSGPGAVDASGVPGGAGGAGRPGRGGGEVGGVAAVRSRRVLWLVVRREVSTRLRSKAFRIMTPLLVVVLAAGISVTALFGGSSPSTVGFLPQDARYGAALTAVGDAAGVDVRAVTVADAAEAERQVRDGKLDAAVTASGPDGFRVIVRHTLDDQGRGLLTAVARQQALDAQVVALGGDLGRVDSAVAAAGVDVVALEAPKERDNARIGLGAVTGVLIYLSLLIFGPVVAQGVVEEKSSRVVELLLGTVRPWQLMAGKVIGIGIIGLIQMALYAAVGVPLAVATGVLSLSLVTALASAGWSLVWYLLGFALYALLFAAAGSLVSRQEDASAVTMPLIMIIIIPYVIGISVLPGDPGSGLLRVLSLIPLSAPLIMPMLIAAGTAAAWQIALGTALTVATIIGLVPLTGRIYAGAVKRTGTRVRLVDALRSR
ncbi:ABC transporter permease [Pseudofrankia asymbiotica]|uniref:ABC transporter permease n=1 Tax=Pseudofrankia asymbiotica TaxID=1834516 RepID=UPI0009D66AD4|nr:ABC transporter permease [Pseudofrankia asymbiotica]